MVIETLFRKREREKIIMKFWRYSSFWIAAWVLLVGITIACRPFIPVNETRYIGIAWEMWLNHHFLVPLLNGVPYPGKPPLMFWITQFDWLITGVNGILPRITIPLFALGTTFTTYFIARRLWPTQKAIALLAPTILTGSLFWAFYQPNYRFDMLITFFTWTTIYGVILTQQHWRRGWIIAGISLGLGILSKGPVIFVFTLPVLLLAPWWLAEKKRSYKRWYLWSSLAILLGILIALAWAIPAAIAGGKQYADAIFFSQTASRLTGYHTNFLSYIPQLPFLLAPWLIWPTFWLAVVNLRKQPLNPGLRFSLIALIIPLIILSLISQKGLRYLLPLFPAFALFAAASLNQLKYDRSYRFSQWPIAIAIYLIGFALSAIPFISYHFPQLIHLPLAISPLWGIILMIIGITWLFWRPEDIQIRTLALAATMVIIIAVFFLSIQRSMEPNYNVKPMAQRLAAIEKNNQPIAYINNIDHYDDEYQYYGRLTKPIDTIQKNQVTQWAQQHPHGWIVSAWPKSWPLPAKLSQAKFWQDFRRHQIAVLWPASAFITSTITTKTQSTS